MAPKSYLRYCGTDALADSQTKLFTIHEAEKKANQSLQFPLEMKRRAPLLQMCGLAPNDNVVVPLFSQAVTTSLPPTPVILPGYFVDSDVMSLLDLDEPAGVPINELATTKQSPTEPSSA